MSVLHHETASTSNHAATTFVKFHVSMELVLDGVRSRVPANLAASTPPSSAVSPTVNVVASSKRGDVVSSPNASVSSVSVQQTTPMKSWVEGGEVARRPRQVRACGEDGEGRTKGSWKHAADMRQHRQQHNVEAEAKLTGERQQAHLTHQCARSLAPVRCVYRVRAAAPRPATSSGRAYHSLWNVVRQDDGAVGEWWVGRRTLGVHARDENARTMQGWCNSRITKYGTDRLLVSNSFLEQNPFKEMRRTGKRGMAPDAPVAPQPRPNEGQKKRIGTARAVVRGGCWTLGRGSGL